MFSMFKSLFGRGQARANARRPAKRTNQRARLCVEALEDRVVPTILFTPQNGVEHATPGTGPVMGTVNWGMPVYTVFWGSYWATSTGQSLASRIEGSLNGMLYNSPYLDGLQQYGVQYRAGVNGSGTVEVFNYTDPSSSGFKDSNVYNIAVDGIQNKGLPAPNAYTNQGVYFVITAPGTFLLNNDGTLSSDGAYHSAATENGQQFEYGWIGSDGTLDGTTYFISHEVVETMTDPHGDAWQVDPRNNSAWNEVADNEAQSYTYRLNGYQVQSYWSQTFGDYEVDDGNTQAFYVAKGRLQVFGDQRANLNDAITIDTTSAGGVRVTLNGEVASFDPGKISSIVVYAGDGSNSVSVNNTNVPVDIAEGVSTTDTVHIGNVGDGVQGIRAAVNLSTINGGTAALTIDDRGDTTAHTVAITAAQVTGLAPAAINYSTAGLRSLTIDGGDGGITFNVTGTSVPTTVNAGSTPDVVNVGNAGSLAGIQGLLTLKGLGSNQVTVDDHANTNASAMVTAILYSNGGVVQRYDASNQAYNFVQFSGFNTESATLGHVDTGLMYDAAGQNTFVTAGSYAYMSGPDYFHYVSGAKYVYGYASAGSSDVAYHYDGSGASALVMSGTAYSFMLGTDNGQSFFNEAVGFTTTYAIANHAGQDTAYIYDSPLNDVFVGNTATSYMYSDNAQGQFVEFDEAEGFAHVYAYSFVGGTDDAYNHDPSHNTLMGWILMG